MTIEEWISTLFAIGLLALTVVAIVIFAHSTITDTYLENSKRRVTLVILFSGGLAFLLIVGGVIPWALGGSVVDVMWTVALVLGVLTILWGVRWIFYRTQFGQGLEGRELEHYYLVQSLRYGFLGHVLLLGAAISSILILELTGR